MSGTWGRISPGQAPDIQPCPQTLQRGDTLQRSELPEPHCHQETLSKRLNLEPQVSRCRTGETVCLWGSSVRTGLLLLCAFGKLSRGSYQAPDIVLSPSPVLPTDSLMRFLGSFSPRLTGGKTEAQGPCLAREPTAGEWCSWDFTPGRLAPGLCSYTPGCNNSRSADTCLHNSYARSFLI